MAKILHTPFCFSFNAKKRIGILGGSFNPAHEGHAHIADMAVRSLDLDELWWMVSPQNPLKTSDDMAPFHKRLESALEIAKTCTLNKRMKITALEKHLKYHLTYQTLSALRNRTQKARLVWVMGSDNLLNFHLWNHPKSIAKNMPIAVVNRPNAKYLRQCRGAKIAGKITSPQKLKARNFPPKTWCYIQGKMNKQSATKIRQKS